MSKASQKADEIIALMTLDRQTGYLNQYGMEKLRTLITQALEEFCPPQPIVDEVDYDAPEGK